MQGKTFKKHFTVLFCLFIVLSLVLGFLKFYWGTMHHPGKSKSIPIPVFHCIDTTVWGDRKMFVSVAAFDAQMKYLKDKGYTAITFQDLGRLQAVRKPVLITFDDGYEDNFSYAYPILKKYGLKATIFLIDSFIDKPRFLTRTQIEQMGDLIDFQSHTLTHKRLSGLSIEKADMELSQSKKRLEALLHKKVDTIAYPYGDYDDKIIQLAKKYYHFGVTCHSGKFRTNVDDSYRIRRLAITDQTDFSSFTRLFN